MPDSGARPSPLAAPVESQATVAVVVDAAASAVEVAAAMTAAGATSAVVAGPEIGIVTDHDLRARVLAADRDGATSIAEIASTPATTVSEGTSLGDALAMMLEGGFQHLPVVSSDGETVVGMVEARRILAAVDPSPFRLGRRVAAATSPDDLAAAASGVAEGVQRLLASGMGALGVLRTVSGIADAVTRRAIELAGEPPGGCAWVALGSQARHEQGFFTDQDHALVTTPGGDAGEFRRWAAGVVDVMERAGFPRCRGGTMASEATWCHDPDGWWRWASDRLELAEPRAVLEAASAMDARLVWGDPSLTVVFGRLRERAAASAPFMARIAAAASHFRVPLGFFGRMSEHFDIKEGAVGPIAVIARVHGLSARSGAEETVGRLRDAEAAGRLSSELGEILRQGFAVAHRIRLEHHLDCLAENSPLDNRISLGRLTSWEEALLKEVFKAIREAQTALESEYQTGYVR
jgi:CBS domain-containing protein